MADDVTSPFCTHRVRTKFSVVDDESDGQAARVRARARKLGPSSQNAETGRDWKPSKSMSYRHNIDISPVNNNSYQIEDTGQITPLPPPLVSACFYFVCVNNVRESTTTFFDM